MSESITLPVMVLENMMSDSFDTGIRLNEYVRVFALQSLGKDSSLEYKKDVYVKAVVANMRAKLTAEPVE